MHGERKQGKWKQELREAIESAADELGPGTHEVTIAQIEARVEVSSPGRVREYRITLET